MRVNGFYFYSLSFLPLRGASVDGGCLAEREQHRGVPVHGVGSGASMTDVFPGHCGARLMATGALSSAFPSADDNRVR
jgi:hypothetical protein